METNSWRIPWLCGINPGWLGWHFSDVADLPYDPKRLFGVEIIKLVLSNFSALDYFVAFTLQVFEGLLAVFKVYLGVVEPSFVLFKILVIDTISAQRLH